MILKKLNRILPRSNAGICYKQNSVKNTEFIWISQGFLENDIAWARYRYFDFKIPASFVANTFCRLHNDIYSKYSPHKKSVNCALIVNSKIFYNWELNMKKRRSPIFIFQEEIKRIHSSLNELIEHFVFLSKALRNSLKG